MISLFALIVAGFQIVVSTISILILTTLAVLVSSTLESRTQESFLSSLFMIFLVMAILYCFVNLFLGIYLWIGIKQKNDRKCGNWLIGYAILFSISFATFFLQPMFAPSVSSWTYYISGLVSIFISIFSIKVVSLFIEDVKREEEELKRAVTASTEITTIDDLDKPSAPNDGVV